MPGCAAIGCNNKSSGKQKSSNVTFHRFPADEVQRQKWIQAVRRKDFIPTKNTSLCSSHFNEEDIDRTSLSCVRIRNGAVPSVFYAFPSYLKTNKTKRKRPKQRATATAKESLPTESSTDTDTDITDNVMPEVTDDNVSPPRSPDASISNRCNADTPVKTALKRKLVGTEQKVLASRKKIKLLQQSKRRLLYYSKVHNFSTMSSPKQTDQESMSSSEQDGESTQDSVKIKDEPVDPGYEKSETPVQNSGNNSNSNSNSNSRSSSPCPPVHFGNVSPAQGRDSPSQGAGSASSGPSTPNDGYSNSSSIRTHMQTPATGKKTDTVQNIVEGLLKKNATLLAMSDAESLRPQRRQKTQDFNNGRKEFSQSAVFPVSSTSQARLVQHEGRRLTQATKPMLLRPKSPTKKCDSLLRDKSQLAYSLMESAVGDEGIEKIFKVQHHELVCAVSSKPYIFDKLNNEKKVVASLDNNYFWCNFCSFSSSNKSIITNHIMDHRFSCKFCPYESFCRSDVLRHMGKMHQEFEEISNNLSYCTFLSDYIRCKTRAEGKENNERTVNQDEDVAPVDDDALKSHHAENLKRKRELEENQEDIPTGKWAKMDSPNDNAPNAQRQGKSRKSQNPRRHPQVNEKDYDTFEMEVEEIEETENGGEPHTERVLYPSSSQENSNDHRNPSMGSHMQLIPSLQDEESHGYTATHVSRPPTHPIRPGRPPAYMNNNRGGHNRSTNRTASASSLYWSCGYCDFQSSSQAEIKEHSNRTHPGKPHRYVALIKNMTPDSIINKTGNRYNTNTSPSLRNPSPAVRNSPSFASVKLDKVSNRFDREGAGMSEDVVNLSNNADDGKLKVRIGTPRGPKKDNTTYKCYHCTYTAKRHSSMKSHIYYKHRGKGLLAVDEDTSTGGQVFFCARDDCSFKSTSPTSYLAHVEQCTPWHKPELADVEVEPHIRECLQQTVTFAEMALDKVDIRNTVPKASLIYDTGQLPATVNIPNKDKTDDDLPSPSSQSGIVSECTNDLDRDNLHRCEMGGVSDEAGGFGSSPHDSSEKVRDGTNDSMLVSQGDKEEGNGRRGSFVKFEALNRSPPSESGEGTDNQVGEDNTTEKCNDSAVVDDTISGNKEGKSIASLKLTFRKVGGATTVCRRSEGDDDEASLVESGSKSGTVAENSSVNKNDYFTKLMEEALVDSSSDSESDSSSGCIPESIGKAIGTVSDGKDLKIRTFSIKGEISTETPSVDNSETSPGVLTHTPLEKRDAVDSGGGDLKNNIDSSKEKVKTEISSLDSSESSSNVHSDTKLLLSCIPARSAAVKAMNRMKPVLCDESDDADAAVQHSGGKKSVSSRSADVHDKSLASSMPSKNAIYDCQYCCHLGASPLRTVKSHLANKHPGQVPSVVNLKFRRLKKKSVFYVCPFSTCTKLFIHFHDLVSHRSTHPSMSLKSRQSSVSSCSVSSPVVHVPSEAENIPDCKVLLQHLSESELLETFEQAGTTSPLPGPSAVKEDDDGRYECLYCTEHYSNNTLSGMKLHYATEHPGQLLVFRDVEAKKKQLASRLYVCEESECEFTALSRADLDVHAKCHKSNCTIVYECAACGWYSSSFWTAKDHLKNEHSIEDNGYLIHMQLSVNENGHTSKKILRTI